MAKEQEAQPQFTLADVLALIQEMNQSNKDATIEAIRELKKPSEEEAKKIADAKARQERNAKQAAEDAKRAEAREAAVRAACKHVKADGKTYFGGQVNGDGKVRPMCLNCREVLPAIVAPDEWKVNGVNMQAPDDVAGGMNFVNRQNLLAWHAATVNECTDPNCKAKAQHEQYRSKNMQAVGA